MYVRRYHIATEEPLVGIEVTDGPLFIHHTGNGKLQGDRYFRGKSGCSFVVPHTQAVRLWSRSDGSASEQPKGFDRSRRGSSTMIIMNPAGPALGISGIEAAEMCSI